MEAREDNKKGNELRSPTKERYRDMQFYGLPYVPLLRKNPSFHDGYHYRSTVHEIAGSFDSLDLSKLVILYIRLLSIHLAINNFHEISKYYLSTSIF